MLALLKKIDTISEDIVAFQNILRAQAMLYLFWGVALQARLI